MNFRSSFSRARIPSRIRNTIAKSLDLAENQIRICGPDEGLGILVALVQIVQHGFLQHSNGSVTTSTNTALGHLGEQSLDQVQPASAGRREVNVIARVSRQPTSNFGDLVCAVVVHDQMHVQLSWKISLDLGEKPQELLMPVPPI